jgi:phosphoribosylglycinamide formyltransferase-1
VGVQFVVLSSSRGTTFQAILDRLADRSLTAPCLGLVADRADRGCVEKAHAAHLPVTIIEREKGEPQETYDRRLQEAILALVNSQTMPNAQRVPLEARAAIGSPFSTSSTEETILACMGWMFIFSPWFIAQWRNRILNVHPALLPQFGGRGLYGLKVHEAVLRSHEHESGITIHLMDEGVDTGPLLLQKRCPVLKDDTPEILKARVQALEREWYPRMLQMIHTGTLKLPAT